METVNNLGALLPINENNGQRAVNARDLHSFLESKQDFSTWMKNRIDQYGFVENQDYQILAPQNYGASWGGNNKVDYALSIDMAKELSMVERSEKGKQARRYFIACEDKLKEAVTKGYVTTTTAKPQQQLTMKDKLTWIKEVQKMLKLNDASTLGLLQQVADPLGLPVPQYVDSKGILISATAALFEYQTGVKINEFNKRMIEKGFLEELSRKSSKGIVKMFKHITPSGLKYGENQVNPKSPQQTQPLYYKHKFLELLKELGLK